MFILPKGANGKRLTIYDYIDENELLKEKIKELEESNKSLDADLQTTRNAKHDLKLQVNQLTDDNARLVDEIEKLKQELAKVKALLEAKQAECDSLKNDLSQKCSELDKLNDEHGQLKLAQGSSDDENLDLKRQLKELQDELTDVTDSLQEIEGLFDAQNNKDKSALPRMKEIYKLISDITKKTFDDKNCQTEEGGISIQGGEVGFEHDTFNFIYEDQKVLISVKRFNGKEGHASCLWQCSAIDGGEMALFTASNGYIYFEDGFDQADLEIDFSQFKMRRDMQYRIEIVDVRGCSITTQFYSSCSFTVAKPGSLTLGQGYIEFVQDVYTVQPNQTHARVRLRRRGDYGMMKKTEIFSRDMTAEEGRDYFNEMGIVTFGANDTYKSIKVRIGKNRGLTQRSFRLELGNNEGLDDMKRQYETEVKIQPLKFSVHYEDGDESADDIESIQSDYFDSALEQVERNFNDFDTSKIDINAPFKIDNVMYFEKRAFFYWLDDGVVEIAFEMEERSFGTWRTMDNNKSAIANTHYKQSSGTVEPGFNLLEIPIYGNEDAIKPIGFGIEVVDSMGRTIQAAVVLQPFDLA